MKGWCPVLCLHLIEKGPEQGRICGRETDWSCWHCHTSRCADHGFLMNGKFFCLTAVRVKLGLTRSDFALSEGPFRPSNGRLT
jgi:hypothetical protein